MPMMNNGNLYIVVNAWVDGKERKVSITLDQYMAQRTAFNTLYGASDMKDYLNGVYSGDDDRKNSIAEHAEVIANRYVDRLDCFIEPVWEECMNDAIDEVLEEEEDE